MAAAVMAALALTGLAPTAAAKAAQGPPVATLPTDPGAYVSFAPSGGAFPLVSASAAPIYVSDADHPGVLRATGDLGKDIASVTRRAPRIVHADAPPAKAPAVVVVGTLGHSPLVDSLASAGKIDAGYLRGKWETSIQQVVENPFPGVTSALVIAGSDQRGTIYGVYDVSRGIGVSPWAFWNDEVPTYRSQLWVLPGRHTQGTPSVKYRGFFINDENPQLGRWAPKFFGPGKAEGYPGGFNSAFFGQVFETMLRLKANYLWPAVWGRAFAEDDPANHETAKRYGVVMGTSHEAPMMRGIEEWNRHAKAAVRDSSGAVTTPGSDPYGGTGEWSFRRNRDAIVAYWRDGLERMKAQGFEGVVTLGMRGAGDVGLPDGDGIELMREIIATQRGLIKEVFGAEDAVPQVWTLYKEVQRYWDKGLRAPDDVIVNFADDNWGNMRKLPDQSLAAHPGGYGIYYHFDYVGVGRNYKWVDTTNLANLWEQLHTASTFGVRSLWVVNVGDLKGNELPTQFLLDYAWDPSRWPLSQLDDWERRYAAEHFGPGLADDVADVLHRYGQLQSVRKPELLNRRITLDPTKDPRTDSTAVVYDDKATPFSLTDYREIERITAQWTALAADVERVRRQVPQRSQDAFFQLVGYAATATANLYELRQAEFTNLLYAEQGRAATNSLAAATAARFAEDQALSEYYNTTLSGGKWDGFQTQPKIGYGDVDRYGPNAPWQQPEKDNEALPDEVFPAVRTLDLPDAAQLGVGIDGSAQWWPNASGEAVLPTFSKYQSQPGQYLEVFNRGKQRFDYTVRSAQPWVSVDKPAGTVTEQERIAVRVNWSKAPAGITRVPLTVTGTEGTSVTVTAVVDNRPLPAGAKGFVEANGYVSMEAANATRVVKAGGVGFQRIPDIGRQEDGMAVTPGTAQRQTPGGDGARLEFDTVLRTVGEVKVTTYLSPRNNVLYTDGLSYAVSIDGAQPQIVNVTATTGADDTSMNPQWARNTSDNVTRTVTVHTIAEPGQHTVQIWAVDPTVIVQKVVVDTGGEKPSYFGPPQSVRVP
ncbi:MAG: glycosyl hydrolase 115 family protein [Kineosporiaceae bacterium]